MKKLIILIGLMMSVNADAGEIVRTPMLDFIPQLDMDYIYEIKTAKFDKVLLDCQSFFNGISFADKGEEKSFVYLNMAMCEEMYQYFSESKAQNLPVCIGLDAEYKELYLTRETADQCI